MKYSDRIEAGRVLAGLMEKYKNSDAIVLAIPNGGIPVGIELARGLNCQLGLMITRKIQFPFTTEAGFGAITSSGYTYIDQAAVRYYNLTKGDVDRQIGHTKKKIQSRMKLYDTELIHPDLKTKVGILVDDGIAGGFTMRVSLEALENEQPASKVVAVPTAPARSIEQIQKFADDIICPDIKHGARFAVADAYRNWYDITDQEALEMLKKFKDHEIARGES